jgi:hypothetical protein
MNDKKLLERLALVSAAWYKASNDALMEAAEKVNTDLKSRGSRQRVLFAQIPFLPEHSFRRATRTCGALTRLRSENCWRY